MAMETIDGSDDEGGDGNGCWFCCFVLFFCFFVCCVCLFVCFGDVLQVQVLHPLSNGKSFVFYFILSTENVEPLARFLSTLNTSVGGENNNIDNI